MIKMPGIILKNQIQTCLIGKQNWGGSILSLKMPTPIPSDIIKPFHLGIMNGNKVETPKFV